MKEGMKMVVWVPDPSRYGCYSSTGVKEDGGVFISDELPEDEAIIMAEQLNREAKGASGGYIVISE